MASQTKRPLYKSPLLPPKQEPWSQSYTVNAVSKDDLGRHIKKKNKVPVIEFKSGEVPMPFLDPSIISQRIQDEKVRISKLNEEKNQDMPVSQT
ncbi:hypothetical protein VTL71DRAFT_5473 [Oculimacula yallundae]|uniref:Uncharacterized protein n=1 Tax=Oculimacula yallundae TaxID=86028 RepID=A0ABR4C3P8_9HELO